MPEERSAMELYRIAGRKLSAAYRCLDHLQSVMTEKSCVNAANATRDISLLTQHLLPLDALLEKLLAKAITDGLTKLRTRGHFEEWIKRKLKNAQNLACIMTDIDNFGVYNDTYTHQQGDQALVAVAQVIQDAGNADYIARYGGEEFSILLAGYTDTTGNLQEKAEAIRSAVESTIIPLFDLDAVISMCDTQNQKELVQVKRMLKRIERSAFATRTNYLSALASIPLRGARDFFAGLQNVTVSIGGAVRKKKESVEHLIYRADKALYAAKESGRNRVIIADQ